jgi:hypothetical protein
MSEAYESAKEAAQVIQKDDNVILYVFTKIDAYFIDQFAKIQLLGI